MKITFYIIAIFFVIAGCDKAAITQQEIYGRWELVSCVNESTHSVVSQSDFKDSNEIRIYFKEDSSFTGSTGRNDFFGKYSIEQGNDKLFFFNFSTTEAAESAWGNLFYDALYFSYNQQTNSFENTYSIQNNNLKIYYSEHKYMLFEKL